MLTKTPGADKAAANQPRTLWDTVLTTTPVIMTVLATILAGLSSSEMTRAQYNRALAAQFQSKAGDQWGFFQAKRTRSTIIEQDLDLYSGRPVRIEPEQLRSALQGVAAALQTAAQQAPRLRQALAKTQEKGSADKSLHEAASRAVARIPDMAREAQQVLAATAPLFTQDQVSRALAFLGTEHLPHEPSQDRSVSDPAVAAALQAVRERKPEDDLAPLIRNVSTTQLQEAVTVAEDNSKAFENGNQWVDASLRKVDEAVKKFTALGHSLHQAAGEVEMALTDLAAAGTSDEDARVAGTALSRADHVVQRRLATLADYTAGRKDYTARRNQREAWYNQQAAWPYELRVAKSSVASERHRLRSQWFFAAMLGAQAATATASLALAARQKSTLWSLAGLVGLAALGFSVYIYLYF